MPEIKKNMQKWCDDNWLACVKLYWMRKWNKILTSDTVVKMAKNARIELICLNFDKLFVQNSCEEI